MTHCRFIPQFFAAWVLFLLGCETRGMPGLIEPPTPTTIPTLISTSTLTPTLTPTAPPTLSASEQANALAKKGVTANADWTPYTEEFNGIKMALVPAGCFPMGISDAQVANAVKLSTSYLDNIRKDDPTIATPSLDLRESDKIEFAYRT